MMKARLIALALVSLASQATSTIASPSPQPQGQLSQTIPFLPDFPTFTGPTQPIFCQTTAVDGTDKHVIAFCFKARNQASEVKDWYNSALTQSGWSLTRATTDGLSIPAQSKLRTCTVTVQSTADREWPTQVLVSYRDR